MAIETPPWFWLVATVLAYLASRALYRRWRTAWLSPLLLTPAALMALAIPLHINYAAYAADARWLSWMLGPVTVAFAVPIWQHRALLRRHWLALSAGMLVGSAVAVASSWGLARALALDVSVSHSLVPRSVTSPFAMPVAERLGGIGELAVVFVAITGFLGATLGSLLLQVLPVKNALSRGALLGAGAHGAGVSRAREIGHEEGTAAALVMVLMGLLNLALTPVLVWLLV